MEQNGTTIFGRKLKMSRSDSWPYERDLPPWAEKKISGTPSDPFKNLHVNPFLDSHQKLLEENNKYHMLLNLIYNAVTNEGINPSYHRRVMAKHRRQWPTLWNAIDKAVQVIEAERNPGGKKYGSIGEEA
jgi:hypothetical protein